VKANFLKHILLICQFELKRLFSTRKGFLYLCTFAVVWYFILVYPLRFAADVLGQGHYSAQDVSFFEFFGLASLLNWEIPVFAVYWHLALLMFPLLCITITADQTCSDRVRGTLRFLALRVSRDSLFFGRFAGAVVIQAVLVVATLITLLMLVIFRDVTLLAPALDSATMIGVNLILVLLPFTAMMAALSVAAKSARQATVWAILIWSFLSGIISGLSFYIPGLEMLKILIPGYQMTELAQLSEWETTLQLAYIPLLQSVVLLAAGRRFMSRQAL
jgi:ABC-2 type transport system permease protein